MSIEKRKAKSKISSVGMFIGSIALLLALTHFWAGPFAAQPTIESAVAGKISSIRTAALDALKGKEPVEESWTVAWDADRIANVATALLGGIALILGVYGIAKSESNRVAGGAIALGTSAIAFQFIAMYVMAFLGVMIIVAIISQFHIDFW